MRPACPLGVRDATVTAEDVEGAVEVTFTSLSSEETVASLRTRVSDAAKQYGPARHAGQGHGGRHGQGHHHGLRLLELRDVVIRFEEVPAGAKLRIAPRYPGDLPRTRAKIHDRVVEMSSRPCED